tara:strand:+ start:1538 stop:1717 length:180 start_codon:yes stop_codon:yes gene_type:complete
MMDGKIEGKINVALVCKHINQSKNWVDLHNKLLRMGQQDPQILVDYILKINGDPFYNKE